jgi:hypothetical protein
MGIYGYRLEVCLYRRLFYKSYDSSVKLRRLLPTQAQSVISKPPQVTKIENITTFQNIQLVLRLKTYKDHAFFSTEDNHALFS